MEPFVSFPCHGDGFVVGDEIMRAAGKVPIADGWPKAYGFAIVGKFPFLRVERRVDSVTAATGAQVSDNLVF